ncbi:NAD(P)-dependent alcohol dehydrogenase [Chryseobacterium sp.]|uniref:zinc-dependent alcohol dehydrogenase family protein n=1 Tax=Chryseobacterium sp. TaxID=1871047 RepID=UPI0025B8F9C1|nr:NAD(P)-dependent alcohol dehydrogenase [Chryseobacterium sp.]MBV8325322.1 NAD(P)-dependent alcohol dehydrogenase [Chryseobacterium sp.]
MKAVQLSQFGIENLKIEDVKKPSPKRGEVLVRIKAVSLNYLDILLANGNFGNKLPGFPYTPASDGAGIIEELGEDVKGWKAGDRVAVQYVQNWIKGDFNAEHNTRVAWQTQGVLAEYVCLPEYGIVKAPENLSFEEVSTLPIAALTAWYALFNQAKLQLGQTVLTQGTGGVSIFALQLAKAAGAKVIATTSTEQKAQKLLQLGADAVVNYIQYPDWHQEVLRLNDGKGVDITLDIAGTKTIEQSLLALKENGFLATAGFISGSGLPIDIHKHSINLSFIRIQGLATGDAESFSKMNRAIEVNNIHPVIDTIYTLEEVVSAYQRLESGNMIGKIVISL